MRNKYIKSILSFICLLTQILNCTANDTTRLHKPIYVTSFKGTNDNGIYTISNTNFLTPFPYRSISTFSTLILADSLKNKFYEVVFNKCSFGVYQLPQTYVNSFPFNTINKNLEFDSCTLNYLILNNLLKNVNISGSNLKVLDIDTATNCEINLNSNANIKVIRIQNGKNINLSLQSNLYNDSPFIRVFSSTVNQIEFFPTLLSKSSIYFQGDTINNHVFSTIANIENENIDNKNFPSQTIIFEDCYINSDFYGFGQYYNTDIQFVHCSFGVNANLDYLGAKKLGFISCKNVPYQIGLSLCNDTSQVQLTIINTDFSNFRFDFFKNIRLTFDSSYTKDAVLQTYQNLLIKYKQEGKENSYELVDIQFQQYKNNYYWSLFLKYWWYYGYKRSYVLIWTIVLIIIFSIVNYINWENVKEVYPMAIEKKRNYYENINYKLKNKVFHFINVFIYTSFIFFALQINLSRVSFRNTIWLCWFFIQYIIGLACLFFIINYILKLN